MAFFPRNFYNTTTEASFTPLFRLLDDFDSYSRQSGSCHAAAKKQPTFQPKFDVREVENAYELHGELPGVSKENVYIEFSDPQTMVIRGKVERVYNSTTATPVDDDVESVTNGDAASIVDDAASIDSKRNSRQPTVADEEENAAQENGQVTKDPAEVVPKETQAAPVDTAKYWLTERSIGEFARSFNFPSRVEQDAVTASFKDGILSVAVPKAKKHESRRIAIN